MQTFVGLMCWFAANVTRSPCFARLTASARAPTPRMSGESKSVRASASSSRWPAATLSAIGRSAGSDTRGIGTSSGARTITATSLPELLHGERHVMPAEPEAVAECELHVTLGRCVRRIVEIALRIRIGVVDRRRYDAVAHDQRAHHELEGAGCAEHVAGG